MNELHEECSKSCEALISQIMGKYLNSWSIKSYLKVVQKGGGGAWLLLDNVQKKGTSFSDVFLKKFTHSVMIFLQNLCNAPISNPFKLWG